jgi:hypothetical protein
VKPVTSEVIEAVLSQGLNDLEPRLVRHGYNAKVLARLLNARPAEVRSFLHGRLPLVALRSSGTRCWGWAFWFPDLFALNLS